MELLDSIRHSPAELMLCTPSPLWATTRPLPFWHLGISFLSASSHFPGTANDSSTDQRTIQYRFGR